MAGVTDADPREIEFRRRWYEAHARRAQADVDAGHFRDWLPDLWTAGAEALEIRNRLTSSDDLDRFRAEQDAWARANDVGFKGQIGAMFINSLVKNTDDRDSVARLLVNGLTAPADSESAAQKMDALVDHVNRIKVGSHPAPLSAAFVLSYFWAQEQPLKWPIFWPNDRKFLAASTGIELSGSPTERYLEFVDLVAELDEDYERFARVSSWWHEKRPVFLDPVLVDRCIFGFDREDRESLEARTNNAHALLAIGDYLGQALLEDISRATGHRLITWKPPLYWIPTTKQTPRPDLWVDWRIDGKGLGEIAVRLWISHKGAALGVLPGWIGKGWKAEAEAAIRSAPVEGFRRIERGPGDMGLFGRKGMFFYGRSYEPQELGDLDLKAEAVKVAAAARPVLNALVSRARDWPPEAEPPRDPLDVVARDLLIERTFFEDIVELLKDKKQVILYGPPGTGKTYLAQNLAEALAPDPADRALVQFHPSTSYEDFFEGFRPKEGPDGQIVYRLTPGPLARMAKRAAEHPHRQVMVIDEINRANLPKVLGELLFLFEYRDRSISTLYRPEGEFELPESLWFIGTMNTADRSIALVDAALRRRFHFVPFFPDRGPTKGLLDRWLKENDQPSWVGKLVAMVNGELTKAINADLQLGPSHFMKLGYLPEPDTDDTKLRMIWEYNIEPLIEDQLFGDPDKIEGFRFESVVARYRSSRGQVDADTAGDSDPDPQVT